MNLIFDDKLCSKVFIFDLKKVCLCICVLFKFSPQDGGRDQNLASEEAIIRSLGISVDDSGISWTSSLATPSHPLSPTGSGVKQGMLVLTLSLLLG